MTDELKRLEEALRAAPPSPPAGARDLALDAALAAFDRQHQETAAAARLRKRSPRDGAFRPGTAIMTLVHSLGARLRRPGRGAAFSRPAMILGSTAVVVLAGVSAVNLELFLPTTEPPALTQALPELSAGAGVRYSKDLRALSTHDNRLRIAESRRSEDVVPLSARGQPEVVYLPHETHALVAAPEAGGRPEVAYLLHRSDATPVRHGRPAAHPEPGDDSGFGPARYGRAGPGGDRFARHGSGALEVAAETPVSTFSVDVDTASYGFVRAVLNAGELPPRDAVRIEELVNYFGYDYPPASGRETPFAVTASVMPTPWNAATRLLHIGIRGFVPAGPRPAANLVFLVDVSGSMEGPDRLPLLVTSLKLMLGALEPDDRVAIVTYADEVATVLEPTPAAQRDRIAAVLDRLQAGGSTAGAGGLQQAYLLAEQGFVEGGINRVILATDGDFNVGIADPDALAAYVARKRDGGVQLSVLGFGRGNLNDELMQALAQNGNGTASYIDTLNEARRILVEEVTASLLTIAGDVKIQVEFNPERISEYRLIGYESRMLAQEDFRNDRVDAGDIGAGHTVTALYEITPAGAGADRIPPRRYETARPPADTDGGGPDLAHEQAFVRIRYRLPGEDVSRLVSRAVTDADAVERIPEAAPDVRFAAAVAAFGQLLRGGRHTGTFGYDDVIALALDARGEDPFGYRAEFLQLVRLAKSAAALPDAPR